MFDDRIGGDHSDQLHHPAVLVRKYVAVQNEGAGEIHEPVSYLDVALCQLAIVVDLCWRDRDRILPDKILVGLVNVVWRFNRGIENFDYLEWIDVDMEWVGDLRGRIRERPFLGIAENHGLVVSALGELPSVDHVLRRRRIYVWQFSTGFPAEIHGPLYPNGGRIDVLQKARKSRVIDFRRKVHRRDDRGSGNREGQDTTIAVYLW